MNLGKEERLVSGLSPRSLGHRGGSKKGPTVKPSKGRDEKLTHSWA